MVSRLERGSRTLWLGSVNTPLLIMHVMWRSHGSKASMLVATDPDPEDILKWGHHSNGQYHSSRVRFKRGRRAGQMGTSSRDVGSTPLALIGQQLGTKVEGRTTNRDAATIMCRPHDVCKKLPDTKMINKLCKFSASKLASKHWTLNASFPGRGFTRTTTYSSRCYSSAIPVQRL